MMLYEPSGSRLCFNRGFRCFGFARTMRSQEAGPWADPGTAIGDTGQTAATMADVDGDGAEELVTIAANGDVWVSKRNFAESDKGNYAVQVFTASPGLGPVTIDASAGDRNYGAQVVAPGMPAFVARDNKGTVKLGPMNSKQSVIMSAAGSDRVMLK